MKIRAICIIIGLIGISFSLQANNDPVLVKVIDANEGHTIFMLPEINGPVQLFSIARQIKEIIPVNGVSFQKVVMNVRRDYYIGHDNEVELITGSNFKKLTKKYFKSSPEILERIGKRGFRFENLPFMILFHNKKITKGVPLTKKDVKNWNIIP